MKHKITAVSGIAEEMRVAPGDTLLSINGAAVKDVLDYRFMVWEEELLLEIAKPSGEIWELEIEKDADEDLGLEFENGLMGCARTCCNQCVFCFIDQMPPGLRPSLYVKDDDPRLSFLQGNYVTLTNLSDAEAARIARYHLSPLHISVHAADAALRQKMMGYRRECDVFAPLRRFAAAGITMHFQIVLCQGHNDGAALDATIEALWALYPHGASLSVVPVGLTRYREGLAEVLPWGADGAAQVVAQVAAWQARCLREHGTAFVFCADEWYIKAGLPLPPYAHYEDFPQLENGVAMAALFRQEFLEALAAQPSQKAAKHAGIVTGRAAEGLMRELAVAFNAKHGAQVDVLPVENHFFGPQVTVSGLLTGQDVMAQAAGFGGGVLFLPPNMFRDGTTQTLDDVSAEAMAATLRVPVQVGNENGGAFANQLLEETV